jgi:hypothetical protein
MSKKRSVTCALSCALALCVNYRLLKESRLCVLPPRGILGFVFIFKGRKLAIFHQELAEDSSFTIDDVLFNFYLVKFLMGANYLETFII